MPVVPIEENKVGIASLTDAKLRPGDFSGSGLEAVGSGLQKIGGAGEELGKALGTKSPAPATPKPPSKAGEANQRDVKADMVGRPIKTLAEQTPKQASDDAAVKAASNRYSEGVRPSLYQGNDALSEKQGELALAAVPATVAHVIKTREEAAAGLTPEQHAAFHIAIAPRVDQDLNWIKGLADAQAKVAQHQASQRVVSNSAEDAILQYGSPAFGEHMATGLKQIDEQAAAGGWTPEAKVMAERRFISGVHRGVSDALSVSDPVAAAEHLRVFGDHMTPEDRAAAWQSLRGPLTQTQAVADLDTLAIARSATAPLTPHGDGHRLMQRMLAITPAGPGSVRENQASADATTDLPALLDRYAGDAAKAWAASEMGADALDALVAKHGPGWFAALPADTRAAVAANMAMLNAVSSPRNAPTPAERAALAKTIADQPWSDERKQNAYDELNTRIGLEARRVRKAQDDAWEKGLGVADQLGADFISINQLPPAVRTGLAPEALAALTLRADRNVHPVTVAGDSDLAWALNRAAATDPARFAQQDLRLYRDQLAPAAYDALERAQKAWGRYPPSASGVTHQRSAEKVIRSGLDSTSAAADQSAPRPSLTSTENHAATNADRQESMIQLGAPMNASFEKGTSNSVDVAAMVDQTGNTQGRKSDDTLPEDDIVVSAPRTIRRPKARSAGVASTPAGSRAATKKNAPSPIDYGAFAQFWSAERKKGNNLPTLVPATSWKKFKPDKGKMLPEQKFGSYDSITLHHTGSEDTPEAVETLHGHESWLHQKLRMVINPGNREDYSSYGDVGYHFMIGKDGTIFEGRSLTYRGAHVMNANERNIGIALLGDYSTTSVTSAQVRSAKILIRELNRAYHVNLNANGLPYVFTHRELAPDGPYARPDELRGAQTQTDDIEAFSRSYSPPLRRKSH